MVYAQEPVAPFIKLVNPFRATNDVQWSRQFIIGATCVGCQLTINSEAVPVFPTGAFAKELKLLPGDTAFVLVATASGKSASKRVAYSYTLPKPAEPVTTLSIESIQTFPEGNLVLQPGDRIRFRVKALPGCLLKTYRNTPLYELPLTQSKGMPGIYQGEYVIAASDSFQLLKMAVQLTDTTGKSIMRQTASAFSVMSPLASSIAVTKGRLAHLEYGLGDDRLGGAKIGYIDSNILLNITGKIGNDYRVQLAKTLTAYIPDDLVELMPKGTYGPSSLTTNWNVSGDDKYDYVKVGLFGRLPYQSFQLLDPSRIIVDIYGATNNTNWITQLENVQEIRNLYYEQKADDIFRVIIDLKHAQHWGHQVFYQGNTLVIKIKHQPDNLSLKNLTIAVDAGHGGSNNGAVGATGVYEKEVTLALSLKLQQTLQKEGAKVIMTRTTEKFFDNKERILFYRDSLPDLLLSIHLNSSVDPFSVGGTGTFYRYVGFRNLSHSIYRKLLELGLKEYGNTGSFNFMLNSPTEYPNVCIEMLFLSNLEEETRILNEQFQQELVNKIVDGMKDFLKDAKE